MRDGNRFLSRAAKYCFGTTLSALIAMAGLTSAAFYASTWGYADLAEPVGFVVLALGGLVSVSFLVGFTLRVASVLLPAPVPVTSEGAPLPEPADELPVTGA